MKGLGVGGAAVYLSLTGLLARKHTQALPEKSMGPYQLPFFGELAEDALPLQIFIGLLAEHIPFGIFEFHLVVRLPLPGCCVLLQFLPH